MYCGDLIHFMATCPRKLKAASRQVEVNLFKENQGKDKEDKGKGKEIELGKV